MLFALIVFLLAQFWLNDAGNVVLPASKTDNYKLINGEDIDITEAPHHVSIWYNGHFWPGALIAKDVVLSIVTEVLSSSEISYAFMKIRAGSSHIDYDGEYVGVRKIRVHPDYDEDTNDYNAALIWLSQPLKLTKKIKVIEMMNRSEEVPDGETAQLTGWGWTQDGEWPKMLQRIEVKVLNATNCEKIIGSKFTARMMCAAASENRYNDGDYGDPLVYQKKLAGLASYYLPPKDRPQIYTKVSSVRDWIEQSIKNNTINYA